MPSALEHGVMDVHSGRTAGKRWLACFALLLSVALAVRLGGVFCWHAWFGETFVFGDSQSYWVLARCIARGAPYQYGTMRVFRSPGYPLVLSPLFLLWHGDPPIWVARVESAILGTLAVAMAGMLALVLFGRTTSLVATAIAAFCPEAIAASVVVLSESAFCPVMMFQLLLWSLADKTRGSKAIALGLAAGVAAGFASLIRPSWLLFVPFVVLIVLLFSRKNWYRVRVGMAVLFGTVLAMAPWWVRNWRVTGRFVPTTLQVGASLYDGLNPQATGASDMSFLPGFIATRCRDIIDKRGSVEFELELDRRLRQAACAYALQNPVRAGQLAIVKLRRMWNIWPNEAAFRHPAIRVTVCVGFLLVTLAAGWAVLCGRLWKWPYCLCWLPAIYFSILHMVFVGSVRYRIPAMIPLCVLAAAGVVMTTKRASFC